MELMLAKPLLALAMTLIVGFLFGFFSRQATIDELRARLKAKNVTTKPKDEVEVVSIDVVYEGTKIIKWKFNGVDVSTTSNSHPFAIANYYSSWYCARYNTERIGDDIQSITRRIQDAVETRVTVNYHNRRTRVYVTIYECGEGPEMFRIEPNGDRVLVIGEVE